MLRTLARWNRTRLATETAAHRGFGASSRRHASRPDASAAAAFEHLESRRVLAAVGWDGGGGDRLWSNPLNWSGDALPGFNDDVIIDLGPGTDPVTVIADVPIIRIKSLFSQEPLVVNRGTALNVREAFVVDGDGGIRINGLVNWVAGTWQGAADHRVNAGGVLNIGGTADPTIGSVAVLSDLTNFGQIAWRGGDLQLSGTLTNTAGKRLDVSAPTPRTLSGPGGLVNHGLLRRGGLDMTTTMLAPGTLVNTDRVYSLRGRLEMAAGLGPPDLHEGSIGSLDPGASVRIVNARTTLAPEALRLVGDGFVQFLGGDHDLVGALPLGQVRVDFTGVHARVGPEGATATSSLAFLGSNLTLDGNLTIESSPPGSMYNYEVRIWDSLVDGPGDLDTTGRSLYVSGATFLARLHASHIVVFEDGPGGLGMRIGPSVSVTAASVDEVSGPITIDANWSLTVTRRLWTAGPAIDGPPQASLILRRAELIRDQQVAGPAVTAITVRTVFAHDDGTDSDNVVRVEGGTLHFVGPIAQMSFDRTTGFMTLNRMDAHVIPGATLLLPGNLESIGPTASIWYDEGGGEIPSIGALQEIRGDLRFTHGLENPLDLFIPAVVNYGDIVSGGDAVFTPPIRNEAGGRIHSVRGTLEIRGYLDASDQFVNLGDISARNSLSAIVLNLDDGGRLGTLVNHGLLESNGTFEVRGSVRNDADGTIALGMASPAVTPLTVTRAIGQGGRVVLRYQGTVGTLPWSCVPVHAATYTGVYATIQVVRTYPEVDYATAYLPSGALSIAWW